MEEIFLAIKEWIVSNKECISVIVDFLGTVATVAAVIVAIVANHKSNKSLNYSLKIQEQSKNVDLYDKRLTLYQDIKSNKNISDVVVRLLFDEKIVVSYQQMLSYREKQHEFRKDKMLSEKLAEDAIRELRLDDDFSRTIVEFKTNMSNPDCPKSVFDEYEAYCKKYEVVYSFTGLDEDYKTYNYNICEDKEHEYELLANKEQQNLLNLIETFIKQSISPIDKN